MPSESVKVMVRIRPMNTREKDKKCTSIADADSSTMQITLTNPNDNDIQKVFAFDAAFPQSCAQQTVYESAAFQLVESVLEGYNGTIFAYGQTGCGKTHTMMGDPSDDNLKGIIPRAFAHIFGNIESTTHKNFLIRCSFIEIYNEEIHDLIGPDVKAKLDLKESTDKGVFIKGLSMQIVKSIPEIEKLMNYGSKNRSVGETAMNKDSSRSHSIFTIYIEASETQDAENQKIVAGKLNLVDLAGSERQSKTQATGDRLKEANKINLSLSALGNVISALVDGKSSHVPYRDSKLTRLLQDSLGGNTKTVMIANISPASDNYDETFGTLRYASRAKSIKNQPKINEDPKDALLREYQDEVARLKAMLEGRAVGGVGSMIHLNSRNSFDDEVEGSYSNVLREKDEALEEEIKRREELESKLKELANQMVVGGSLPISPGKNKKAEEPQEKKAYQEMLNKLKTQEQLQQKLLEERQKKEEEAQEVEKKYANLQEEAEEVRKIAKKLRKKYKSLQAEIKDFDRDQEYYKGELLDTIRSLERDVKINNAIMAFLLSPFELEKIRSNSNWSEEKNEFIVPKFQLKVKKAKLPQLPGLNGIGGNTLSLPSKDDDRISENPDDEDDDYGEDKDWDEGEPQVPSVKNSPHGERTFSKESNNQYMKNTRNNFFSAGGGMRETKKDNNQPQSQHMAPTMRNPNLNISKYPNQNLSEYESKNPNIISQYAKLEKSPVYAKKQPNAVRLDPINQGSLSTNLNSMNTNTKGSDFVANLLESGSLPKLGRQQLKPINQITNTNPNPNNGANKMKLQFKATVFIDQDKNF